MATKTGIIALLAGFGAIMPPGPLNVALNVIFKTFATRDLRRMMHRVIVGICVSLMAGCTTTTNTTIGNGTLQDLAVSPNRRYVLVWDDGAPPNNYCPPNTPGSPFSCRLYARAYDPAGAPVTGQVLVSPVVGHYYDIQAAINDSGAFVIVYDHYVYNSNNPALSSHLFLQRYSLGGTPLGPPQFVDYGEKPDVALTATGDSYVTYHSNSSFLTPTQHVHVQKYSASGAPAWPRITVDTATQVAESTIKPLCSGEFIVAYSAGASNISQSTYIRRYHTNGSANGVRILADTTSNERGIPNTLIVKPTGEFAIISERPSGGTSDYFVKRYGASGSLSAAPEFLFNKLGILGVGSMSANTCGDYALAYVADSSGEIMVKEYMRNDTPIQAYGISQAPASPAFDLRPMIALGSISYVAAWDRRTTANANPRDKLHVRRPLVAALQSPTVNPTHTRVCYFTCNDCPRSRVVGNVAAAGQTYAWSPTTNLNNPNVAQPTVTHPGGTNDFDITYTVTITAGCCQRTEVVTVTFAPKCPT